MQTLLERYVTMVEFTHFDYERLHVVPQSWLENGQLNTESRLNYPWLDSFQSSKSVKSFVKDAMAF